jgi:hypothetical protein
MKTIAGFLSLALASSSWAQTNHAAVNVYCRSIVFPPGTAYTPGVGSCDTLFGVARQTASGWVSNGELRPVPGPSNRFQAAYTMLQLGNRVQYGTFLIDLPTMDSDQNGISDVLEATKSLNVTVKGSGQSPAGKFVLSGTATRNAGSLTGSYRVRSTSSAGYVDLDGSLQIQNLQGTAAYTTNAISLQFTIDDNQGSPVIMTGQAPLLVGSTDEATLRACRLQGTDGTRMDLVFATLKRMGSRYVWECALADGNTETPGPDFTRWIMEITDSNDYNNNGIPDLSDPVAPPDTTIPKLSILSPVANYRCTNVVLEVKGTSSDPAGMALVECSIQNAKGAGAYSPANGTTNWTAAMTGLLPGTNLLWVRAKDLAGNAAEVSRLITYVPVWPLSVQIAGGGSVSPNLHGKLLEIGKKYALSAKPSAGNLFSNWTGGVFTNRASFSFVMESNLLLQANFIPNPFLPLKGTYNGLARRSTAVELSTAGYITLTTTAAGKYSGKLTMGGKALALAGTFNLDKSLAKSLPRAGTTPLNVALQLSTEGMVTGSVSDGSFSAEILANKSPFSSTNGCPWEAKYTVCLPGEPGDDSQPAGHSYGIVTVDRSGNVSFTGWLADGTAVPVSQKTTISAGGHWPLYVPLHKGSGMLLSWMHFTNQAASDISGVVHWSKPPVANARYYPAGFIQETEMVGSRYIPPSADLEVLSWVQGFADFSGCNPGASFSTEIFLYQGVSAGTNKMTLKWDRAKGTCTGTIGFPGQTRTTPFQGVVFGKLARAYGYFLGTNCSGAVVLRPLLPPQSPELPR